MALKFALIALFNLVLLARFGIAVALPKVQQHTGRLPLLLHYHPYIIRL